MSASPLRPAALVAGLAVLALGVSACGSGQVGEPTGPGSPTIRVVASTDVWGAVAQQVGGSDARVDSIIDSPSVDPHGYEATPQDAATVHKAQLVVVNGGGYDAFMTDLVGASGNAAPVVDAVETSGPAGTDGAHDHEHGAFDEHVWYDPSIVQRVAEQIADRMAEIRPADADHFRTNARAVGRGISQLMSKATSIGARHPNARVAVTEPVPDHLLASAHVQQVTPPEFTEAVEEGTDPPAAVVARTLDLFRARPPVDALIVNPQTESASTGQVRKAAEDAGVPVIEMSETLPDGVTDYTRWMNSNLDELNDALDR